MGIYYIGAYCCAVTLHMTLKFAAINGERERKKQPWANKPFVLISIRTAVNSYEYM